MLAVAVWIAGTRLGRCARDIAERTHAGQAFIGTLLLGGVASLPEAAMACSAAVLGNQRLAVNVLLGGIVFSVLVLAIADFVTGVEPLSSDVRHPVILLQGAFVVLLLVVAAAALVMGDVKVWLAGAWTTGLAALGTVLLLVIRRRQRLDPWRPEPSRVGDASSGAEPEPPARTASPPRLAVEALVTAATILCAGYLLAGTADAIGHQSQLGAGLAGFILGGIATSLPEASSTIAAARLRRYEMAFSDAFGTNFFSVMLLFLVDLAYGKAPILAGGDRFSLLGCLLGIALTAVYLAGLVERPHRTFLRMGLDSLLVLVLAGAGMVLLFFVR